MKLLRIQLLLVIAMTLASGPSCNAATKSRTSASHRTETATVRATADTVEVMSRKMGRAIKNVVTVPSAYYAATSSSVRYPVLYLLHGAYGDYSNWSKKKDLHAIADRYGVIIVCPDGQDSWYFDSPIDPKMQFETYVSQELVSYVDSHYRTLAQKEMRAIAGLSMGGHGAMWLGLRHPDVFNSIGCMSGGVDITKFPGKWHIPDRLGNYDDNKEVWASHSVINLVPTIKPGQNIIIDDGYDDFFYEVNLNLHKALLDHKIPHDFTIRPGRHSWDYWCNSLDYQMLFFDKAFKAAAAQKQ